MKEKEFERQKFREDTLNAVKVVKKMKPLYKVYEEKFKEEIEMPELQLKKKQLEEIRGFY